MKIVIPGGSGQVGTQLARAFHHDGHTVVVLSRYPQPRPWTVVLWDGATLEDLAQVMGDASICGLGQAAPNPIRCIQKYFPQEIAA